MVSAELLNQVVLAVKSVSQSVLPFYHGEAPLDINTKHDGSSVTAADCCLDLLLRQRLVQLLPDVPVLSEEGHIPTWDERQQWDCYWCVVCARQSKKTLIYASLILVNINITNIQLIF